MKEQKKRLWGRPLITVLGSIGAIAVPFADSLNDTVFSKEPKSKTQQQVQTGCAAFLIDRYRYDSPETPVKIETKITPSGRKVYFTYPQENIKGVCERIGENVIAREIGCMGPNELKISERTARSTSSLIANESNAVHPLPVEDRVVEDCPEYMKTLVGQP